MSIADKFEVIADEVYDKGILEGDKNVWGLFQNFGQPKSYCCAFVGWDEKYFYPKYDIVFREGSGADDTGSATSVFRRFQSETVNGVELKKPIDLAQRLEECGVILDTSRVQSFTYTFSFSNISRVPIIDISNAPSMGYMLFYHSKVETIDKLILKDDGSQSGNSNNFEGCSNLKNITIEGVIGSTFNIRWSTLLEKESIKSIVNALSSSITGQSVIFSKTAVNNAFGINVDDPSTYPEGSEYYKLRQSKENWTFSYM